jgi:hypothetical protein
MASPGRYSTISQSQAEVQLRPGDETSPACRPGSGPRESLSKSRSGPAPRADGTITPEYESALVGRLLRDWALRSSLDASMASAASWRRHGGRVVHAELPTLPAMLHSSLVKLI